MLFKDKDIAEAYRRTRRWYVTIAAALITIHLAGVSAPESWTTIRIFTIDLGNASRPLSIYLIAWVALAWLSYVYWTFLNARNLEGLRRVAGEIRKKLAAEKAFERHKNDYEGWVRDHPDIDWTYSVEFHNYSAAGWDYDITAFNSANVTENRQIAANNRLPPEDLPPISQAVRRRRWRFPHDIELYFPIAVAVTAVLVASIDGLLLRSDEPIRRASLGDTNSAALHSDLVIVESSDLRYTRSSDGIGRYEISVLLSSRCRNWFVAQGLLIYKEDAVGVLTDNTSLFQWNNVLVPAGERVQWTIYRVAPRPDELLAQPHNLHDQLQQLIDEFELRRKNFIDSHKGDRSATYIGHWWLPTDSPEPLKRLRDQLIETEGIIIIDNSRKEFSDLYPDSIKIVDPFEGVNLSIELQIDRTETALRD